MTRLEDELRRLEADMEALERATASLEPPQRPGRPISRPRPGVLVLGARKAWWWVCWGWHWIFVGFVALWAALQSLGRRRRGT